MSPTVAATTMTISGSVPSGTRVNGFYVQWQRDTSVGCSNKNYNNITNDSNSFTEHTITGLEPGNKYTINVTVSNGAGNSPVSNSVTAMTREEGEREISVNFPIITVKPYPPTAPSAPPSSVKLSVDSSTSVNVTWRPVECRNRNGQIIGYSVRYGEEGGGQIRIGPLEDSRGGMTTISGLTKQTVYTIEVAARTSAGTGVYSDPQAIETPDSKQRFLIPFY